MPEHSRAESYSRRHQVGARCTLSREPKLERSQVALMAPIHIPNELVDKIIDCLSHEKTVLSNCSLVGQSWTTRSQLHLWKEIHIFCDNAQECLTRFIDCVRRSPVLGSRVKTFTLSWADKQFYWKSAHEFAHELISAVLQLLTQLENISFHATRLNIAPISGLTLSSSVSKLSLSKTRFDTMLDFHRLVTAFPLLRVLHIGEGVDWGIGEDVDRESEEDAESVERQAIDLVELSLCVSEWSGDNFVVEWISLLKSIKLDKFQFIPHHYDFSGVEETWKPVWNKLVSQTPRLTCDMRSCMENTYFAGPLYAEEPVALDLGHARSLRNFTLLHDVDHFPIWSRLLVNNVFPTLPSDGELDSCLVCLYDPKYEARIGENNIKKRKQPCTRVFGEDGNVREDVGGVYEPDYDGIRDMWAHLMDSYTPFLPPSEPRLRCKPEHISVRLMHPLRWTEGLCQVVIGLQSEQVPFQLEYSGADRIPHVFVQ